MDRSTYVWRSSPTLRAIAWVVVCGYPLAFLVVMASQTIGAGTEPMAAFLTMLLFAPMPVGAWLYTLRPWVRADEMGVTVRNPLSTWTVGYSEILDCVPGYTGLVFHTVLGTVTATAIQKSNIASWMDRETRSDRIARLIQERALGA